MKIIKKDDKIVALVFDGKFEEGTKPLTDERWPLQVISLKHPKGKVLAAHCHRDTQRVTESLMEMLLVLTGRARITIYYHQMPLETVELSASQGVMIVDGGIGIDVLEDAGMMEFKNGPFIEDKIII
ncbi:MAG: hypothetical protein V1719_00725 [Patescibacteria group bacterium]